MTDATTTDALTSRALIGLGEAVPSLPGDSPNAPLRRRLTIGLLALAAIAEALPDNQDPTPFAEEIELVRLAYTTADRIAERCRSEVAPVLQELPQGWRLPSFTEARLG